MPSSAPESSEDWFDRFREGLTEHQRERTEIARATDISLPPLERYEIGERLGSGATAVVHRAVDRDLGRTVALKIFKDTQDNVEIGQRFMREAQAAARLLHPNIVTLHDAGVNGGRMYLVMEYVDGVHLSRVIKEGSLELRRLIELLEKAARGVAHAHKNGIVHRDLKPRNILVTPSREPKVTDFGLAFMMGASTGVTRTGTPVGTPCYMAPEQVSGRRDEITPRTDVYSLGAILYEMLTGRPPHTGDSVPEVYAKITGGEEPAAPRALNPAVPKELEAICLKALEKDPARRYPSAEEFADDLLRYLEGDPVHARPVTVSRRMWRNVARRRAVVIPAAVALVFALAFAVSTLNAAAERARQIRTKLEEAARLEKEGKIQDAWTVYRDVLQIDTSSVPAREGELRTKTELDRRARDLEEAQRLFETGRPSLEHASAWLYRPTVDYAALVREVKAGQALIEEGLIKGPDLAVGHYLMGWSWELMGWSDRAVASARRAIKLDPEFAPARYLLGRLLLESSLLISLSERTSPGRIAARLETARRVAKEAEDHLLKALSPRVAPDTHMDLLAAQAALAYLGGNRAEVQRLRDRVVSDFPKRREGMEIFHVLAALAAESETTPGALDEPLAIRPQYPLALFLRGQARQREGDAEGAIRDYSEALRINPRFALALTDRGSLYTERKLFDTAARDIEEALSLDPGCVVTLVARGRLHEMLGDDGNALADYTEALQQDPECVPVYVSRALLRMRIGSLDEARADLDRSVELDPKCADAFVARGRLSFMGGELDAAIEDLTRAVGLNPRLARAFETRAYARSAKGDVKGAIEDCTSALAITPEDTVLHLNRGVWREKIGDRKGAIDDYTRALQINSRFATALEYRAAALQKEGDLQGAIDDYTSALQIAPANAALYVSRGLALEEVGDMNGAIADYSRALDFRPDHVQAYFYRALAKARLSDEEGCVADLRKALDAAPPDWPQRKKAEELLRAHGGSPK